MKIYRVLKKNSLYNLRLLYLKTNEETYFNEILQRFNNFMKKYISLYTNNRFDYEDLFQWARIGLWKGVLKNLDSKKESYIVNNIVYSIKTEVHNQFNKLDKAIKNENTELVMEPQGHYLDPFETIYKSEIIESLYTKLTDYQKVVLDYLFQGYRQADIARTLKKRIECINDATIRIRSKLKKLGGL